MAVTMAMQSVTRTQRSNVRSGFKGGTGEMRLHGTFSSPELLVFNSLNIIEGLQTS